MKRHAPFIAMTVAAFLLLFTAISRGDEPSPFLDAAADALPDAVVSESLPAVREEVTITSVVTPSRVPDCPDGSCRVAVRSDADKSNSVVASDDRPRPFRRGLFRRRFSR